ncbi:hypothetical protein KEM48_014568 [Puccinia striiformis f. sp. tritici PST-130]|nr:hypothetical protein KEM48_014568 [Puccinia striiformis f. sp. tritici PST-130]
MAGMESHVQHTAKELDSEQYIAEILNPARKSGLARDHWLRLTHSVAARVHLIDQDFKSLRAGLNRVIHEIQEEISTLGREIFKLQGKELTDTATHQDDHMTESQPSKVIGDANIGSSDKMFV